MLKAWEEELPSDDPDRTVLLEGVANGFHIIHQDKLNNLKPVSLQNYKSATNSQNKHKVEKQIQNELVNGRYIIVDQPATITSALGAVPKKGSDSVRLIHDCSRPYGDSVNDLSSPISFSYQSLQDAIQLIKPDYYLAKLDLLSAYRSVRIHPSNYAVTGIHWT